MKAEITRKYCSGKTPALIWLYSCAGGALVASVSELYLHSDPDGRSWGGMLMRLLFTNLIFCIPVFCFQAHFVCLALQKSINKAKSSQGSILTIGLVAMALVNYYFTTRTRENRSEITELMWINFASVSFTWILMSVFSIRKMK
ncbi:MAG TPA: hypothetical protein VL651_14125 [Bacteroidia bacterium]|jgi:hypothetical protein|nr:hypothetical protein [Bacteroidia bacterium]